SKERLGIRGEPVDFGAQLAAAGGGEAIEFRATVGVGDAPLGVDPAAILEAMECEVERAVLDVERVARGVLDPTGDRVPVARAPDEGLEDERVERALDEREVGRHVEAACLPEMIR